MHWVAWALHTHDLGEPHRAIEFCDQALAVALEIGDLRLEHNALVTLGQVYAALGDPRRAIEFDEHALAITREIGDRSGEGNALVALGLVYTDLGESHRAVQFYEQAIACLDGMESPTTDNAADVPCPTSCCASRSDSGTPPPLAICPRRAHRCLPRRPRRRR